MTTFKNTMLMMASAMLGLFINQAVFASTAANTTITNIVTVSFDDAADQAQTPVQASVSILVNLVAAAPTLSSPADIDPTTENTANNLVYTITSNANGPDTYNFSSVDTRTNMNADAGFTTPGITLGGTTLAIDAVAGNGFITVPYDGASDNDVNGITDGNTIEIGGAIYTVGTIDEAGTLSNNTVQIPLTTNIAGATVSAGSIVGEQASVTVVATTNFITSGTSGTHSIVSTATSADDILVSTAQATATVITVRRPVLTITKFVRNITDPALTGAGPETIGADTWYASGVSGKPGDVMEYLIVVDNTTAGADTAKNIVISDPIPQFTAFVGGSVLLDDDGTAVNLAGFATLNETVDSGDAAELDTTENGTIRIYAGVGGDDSGVGATVGTGGDLNAGEISRAVFQVTIQ